MASIGLEFGFDQEPPINGLHFKITYRCCDKNVFQDPTDDDSEGWVSFYVDLEDAMLAMACYFLRVRSILMLDTKMVVKQCSQK